MVVHQQLVGQKERQQRVKVVQKWEMGKMGKEVFCGKMNSALGYYACGEFYRWLDERPRHGIWSHGLGPQYGGDLRGLL